MKTQQVQTEAEIDMIRSLFREYEAFLNVDLCFQGFEKELARLPGKYSPPDGALLLGLIGDEAVGCVALRKIDEGVCEMKRLYVNPTARGTGLGRKLVDDIIAIARARGYALMRLDTLDTLTEAMNLYQRLGFRQIAPYYENPLPGAIYWELTLS
jgi:ribosomal protein S18 acetylase RimI-like enzyme